MNGYTVGYEETVPILFPMKKYPAPQISWVFPHETKSIRTAKQVISLKG